MKIDFVETYMPSTLELNIQDVQTTRQQLSNYMEVSFPDIAHNPGTVLGDLIVTPQSYVVTALQQGIENLVSDITLSNVAQGTIFNCDFVQDYIKNYGVDTSLYYPSSGVLRLVFSEDKTYELDRSTQFRLGADIYSIYLPNNGNFFCLSSTEVHKDGVNACTLKDTGSGMWFCDVPVVGKVGEVTITAGTSGEVSELIPELYSIQALDDFSSGVISDSLPNLAKKTQTTSFSASLNTRYGAIQYINATCPFAESIYALRDGDKDLLRTYQNQYGIASGCLDVFARTQSYEFTERQQVKLTLSDDGQWLEGDWIYTGQPYHLESITHPSIDAKDLEDREIISTSDPDLHLGAIAAYTKHEKLHIRLRNLFDASNNSLFTFQLDPDTAKQYTYVTVTYQTDPLFPALAATTENEDYSPINANVLVRGFIPIIISQFDIIYTKLPGVIPNLEEAKDKIKIYLGKVGAPNQFSIAEIAKIMQEAGVNYLKDIDVTAKVQWTVGTHVQNMQGEIEPVLQTEIKSADDLRVYYPNNDETLVSTDMYACSPKIIRYYVLENSIKFKEVRDV